VGLNKNFIKMYSENNDSGDFRERSSDDVFSKPVRAGKRTYFFDVKTTKGNDYYLTITESKKRVDKDGRFTYDKHKIFLYKEDFEKFSQGLEEIIGYIRERLPAGVEVEREEERIPFTDLSFEDI